MNMTNNPYRTLDTPLSKEDWTEILTIIYKINGNTTSNVSFLDKFFNISRANNYFSSELLEEINQFSKEFYYKREDLISKAWIDRFHDKINLQDHFSLLSLMNSSYVDSQKRFIEYLEKNYSKEDIFKLTTRFFLDEPAYVYKNVATYWMQNLEKYNYPINKEAVKHITNAIYTSGSKHWSTNDKMWGLKSLILSHTYEPNIKTIENYINNYSKDALFLKRANTYLEKKNIPLNLTTKDISITKNEIFKYSIRFEVQFFIKEHDFTKKHAEKFIIEILNFLNSSYPNNLYTSSLSLETNCETIEILQKTKNEIDSITEKINILAPLYKERALNMSEAEGTQFIKDAIYSFAMHQNLTKTLETKDTIKKRKI